MICLVSIVIWVVVIFWCMLKWVVLVCSCVLVVVMWNGCGLVWLLMKILLCSRCISCWLVLKVRFMVLLVFRVSRLLLGRVRWCCLLMLVCWLVS